MLNDETTDQDSHQNIQSHTLQAKNQTAHSPGILIPLALFALSMLLWMGFQTVQLVRERENLQSSLSGQESMVQNSQKLRRSLDGLATRTARLAEGGNANAKLLVDELKKRGVTIDANGPQQK